MLVKTTTGTTIWIEKTDGKSLFDNNNTPWHRYPIADDKDHAGYRDSLEPSNVLKLTRTELKRICAGPSSIVTPTTVKEMRFYSKRFTKKEEWMVDSWTDYALSQILEEANNTHKNAGELLKRRVEDALRPPIVEQVHEERPEGAKKEASAAGTTKNTPKKRKREESTLVTTEEISVMLTPKQLEFMERLSENQDWSEKGVDGEYVASLYAEELSDTMNSMSVGAVLTTLREKKLLTTKRSSVAGVKICLFTLTPAGKAVYRYLCNYNKEGGVK